MNKLIIVLIFASWSVNAQINSKIEGITLNTPCELEYIRNLGNQNNYSCPFQYGNNKIDNYSVTVSNLQTEMNGLTGNTLNEFKKTFLHTIKSNSDSLGEITNYIDLPNGIKAVSSVSYLTYGNQKFKNISISFLFKQKSFIVNLTTNDLNGRNDMQKLVNTIILQ